MVQRNKREAPALSGSLIAAMALRLQVDQLLADGKPSTWIVNPVPDPALPQRQSEHLAKTWSKLSLNMLRPFPVRWISLACSGNSLFWSPGNSQAIHLNFHRKGEAGTAILGLQGQNFPVFSRQTGKDKAETGSPMTVSTASYRLPAAHVGVVIPLQTRFLAVRAG